MFYLVAELLVWVFLVWGGLFGFWCHSWLFLLALTSPLSCTENEKRLGIDPYLWAFEWESTLLEVILCALLCENYLKRGSVLVKNFKNFQFTHCLRNAFISLARRGSPVRRTMKNTACPLEFSLWTRYTFMKQKKHNLTTWGSDQNKHLFLFV